MFFKFSLVTLTLLQFLRPDISQAVEIIIPPSPKIEYFIGAKASTPLGISAHIGVDFSHSHYFDVGFQSLPRAMIPLSGSLIDRLYKNTNSLSNDSALNALTKNHNYSILFQYGKSFPNNWRLNFGYGISVFSGEIEFDKMSVFSNGDFTEAAKGLDAYGMKKIKISGSSQYYSIHLTKFVFVQSKNKLGINFGVQKYVSTLVTTQSNSVSFNESALGRSSLSRSENDIIRFFERPGLLPFIGLYFEY